MTDIAVVRNEIKTWERNFKSENGRDPSIQDIKDQPSIAQKYKLYKKLSKAAAVALSLNASTSSTTTPRTLSILSNQRPIEPTAPLSSFNPFSPTKNKSNCKVREELRFNPFATPVKPKSKPVDQRELSPDPFPAIQPQISISNFQLPSFAPTSALSRARKRLRGEPVSPSPNKDKRRRVGSPTALPFTTANSQSPSDDEDDLHLGDANSSFVDDSPVKAPAGGKPFKLLFEEAVPFNTKLNNAKGTFSKTTSGFFGNPSSQMSSFGNDPDGVGDRKKRPTNRKPGIPSGNLLRQDDPFSDDLGQNAVTGGLRPEPRTSAKRTLSDTELEHNESLLPPSPPPADAYARPSAKHKGKEKAKGAGRKKVKVVKEVDSEEDDDSEGDSNVKVVSHSHGPRHAEDDQDLDLGPILRFRAHRGRPHGSSAPADQGDDMSKFEVDLPDRIRSVLAISPSKPRDSKEERVVRGLLYGGRAYDPVKGGEVWDVGELDDESRAGNTEGEDDWEGEPVPWEVGEL